MTCCCLRRLEQELIRVGIEETYRGPAWGEGTREWVYFTCLLDLPSLRAKFNLPKHVVDHSHAGTHDGRELGFICQLHLDGIMGRHPSMGAGVPRFQG